MSNRRLFLKSLPVLVSALLITPQKKKTLPDMGPMPDCHKAFLAELQRTKYIQRAVLRRIEAGEFEQFK